MYKGLLIIFILVQFNCPAFAQKKTYKWVDEHGVTHYGDRIPVEDSNKPNVELSPKGVVLKKNQSAAPEDLEKKKAEEEQKKKEQKLNAEIRRKNQILLDSYSNPEEIDLAKQRYLQQTSLDVKSAEARIAELEKKKARLSQEAAAYQKKNQPIPEDNKRGLSDADEQIATLQKFISNKNVEIETTCKKFDADKQRYVELTAKPQDPAPAANVSTIPKK